ncbi:dihydroanticapsin 7-dehydrogenase [Streptomyces avermitilis]|uniref:Uncharacterized protein n=1 Tax=Streptomyces avermitilis TaxID=33903 RepID=A0A4D4M7R2_STRAX|nr:hypothetical protein SAVMC3_85230 [Streptomyces avermitilis]GDY67844.1 hypothetical protein SAV14893_072370 [Streptomyces avermitilis]GDY71835.1 hypothetical protein SAV31267_013200 [Streptomyces avermitilis]GDY81011.1 hypothetical protein SAVCW2_02100 [Streptomyces avermitilis]
MADRESVHAAVARAVDVFGSLGVLVDNAYGCTPDAPLFEDEPEGVWARDLDLTLIGAYRCCRAALPHLVALGRGAIVNIGSVNGLQDFGDHAYSASTPVSGGPFADAASLEVRRAPKRRPSPGRPAPGRCPPLTCASC